MAVMKSWVAAPSLFCAGSRVDHAPEYPALSRTVIEPPALGAAVEDDVEVEDEVGLVLFVEEFELLLQAAAARVSAAAPARQAVRIDLSRKLTAFTYS
jgi:hypothetical protein